VRRAGVVPAAIAVALAACAAARADVLVNAPPPSVSCAGGIKVGVWYQSFSGGPRWARIAIRTAAGRTVWHRSVAAGTRWRYWRFHGRCGRRYAVIYETHAGRTRFNVRIRPR
jgi:hypothetical protein